MITSISLGVDGQVAEALRKSMSLVGSNVSRLIGDGYVLDIGERLDLRPHSQGVGLRPFTRLQSEGNEVELFSWGVGDAQRDQRGLCEVIFHTTERDEYVKRFHGAICLIMDLKVPDENIRLQLAQPWQEMFFPGYEVKLPRLTAHAGMLQDMQGLLDQYSRDTNGSRAFALAIRGGFSNMTYPFQDAMYTFLMHPSYPSYGYYCPGVPADSGR